MKIFEKIGICGCIQSQKTRKDERISESEKDARTQKTDNQEAEQKESKVPVADEATIVPGQEEPTIRTLSESDTNGDTTSSSGTHTEEQNDKSGIAGCALNYITEQDELEALTAPEATTVLGQEEPTIRTLSESDTNGDTTSSSGTHTEEQNDKSGIAGCALNYITEQDELEALTAPEATPVLVRAELAIRTFSESDTNGDTTSSSVSHTEQQNDKSDTPGCALNKPSTFKNQDDSSNSDSLSRVKTPEIHELETADLIHQVDLDLWEENMQVNESPYGVLTVRIKFEGNSLQVEVMNAKILIPMDSNGLCDSFVKVHILPKRKFKNIGKLPKTQTHKKNIIPIYDERFELNLTEEQTKVDNGLLLFSLKHKVLFRDNKYVGEAFIHFKDIPDTNTPLTSLPEVNLQLIRPKAKATDAVKALEHRQGDKLAKKFLKKFRQRMGST